MGGVYIKDFPFLVFLSFSSSSREKDVKYISDDVVSLYLFPIKMGSPR